jgi:UDP-N-acetylmuramate--alanine ligase
MIAVVTNIDRDHMETYAGDFERPNRPLLRFLHHVPFYGMAVLCIEDTGVREILPHISKPVRTYGFNADADVRAVDIHQEGMRSRFRVEQTGRSRV